MLRVLIVTILLLFSGLDAVQAGVVGSEVNYSADGVEMKGYIAHNDKITTRRPGVLVVHEWWGHNGYARKRADMLAAEGYVALAVDMYGEGRQAAHPDEAGKFAGEVRKNLPMARRRFMAALETLKKHPMTDQDNLAAIGYCFGGGVVLQMARDGLDLKAVASFHGSLGTAEPAAPGKVKAAILVSNGGDDKFIPLEEINGFIKEMITAGADFSFHSYPGAMHSFTNPGADHFAEKFKMPVAYQEKADKDSWREMHAFFTRIFGK